MSSRIMLDSICVENNPSLFTEPIHLKVTFSSLEPLTDELEWRIIYVGSAFNEDYDQTLEVFEVGPIAQPSTMQFMIECSPPNPYKVPKNQLLCVTALLLTVSYKRQEFIRVGYYVHNQLAEEIQAPDTLQLQDIVRKIKRTIISDKPRVTKFNINWEQNPNEKALAETEQDAHSKSQLEDDKLEGKKDNQKMGEISA